MTARVGRPAYEFPRSALAGFGIDLLLGRHRSFTSDADILLGANHHPRRIEGLEHVSADGAFVLVMNHLSRRGLRPYHVAMLVSAAVARVRGRPDEIRWAFTSEYYGRKIGPFPVPLQLIRWVFRRVAHAYGFVVIQRQEERVRERAGALRRLDRLLRGGSPVGLTPEGAETGASGVLVEPPAGNGRFLIALSRGHIPLLAVGAFEEGGALVVRFGAPLPLAAPRRMSTDELDRWAAREVMGRIAALLPPAYRGAYAGAAAAPDSPRSSTS